MLYARNWGDDNETIFLKEEAAQALYNHPYVSNVRMLRNAYESSGTVPWRRINPDLEKAFGGWMPNYCLRAMGRIGTLDALEGIKSGFKHPWEGVQYNAARALDEWITINAGLIQEGKLSGDADERKELIKKLISRYGYNPHQSAYGKVNYQITIH